MSESRHNLKVHSNRQRLYPLLFTFAFIVVVLSGCGGGGPPLGPQSCTNQKDGDYPGCGVSKSTYSCNDPVAGWNFLNKYFPVETPTDECSDHICQCPASGQFQTWQIQQGRVYTKRAGATSQGGHAGNGFGLHLVNVSQHWTTGGKSTLEVEQIFNGKLGDMSKFDAFMDYNVVLGTAGLQKYKDMFTADRVPFLPATWSSLDGKNYTSIFVQVPSTQMVLELVQQTQLTYDVSGSKPLILEQRVSTDALRSHEETMSGFLAARGNSVGTIVKPLAVNRAASAAAMAKLDDFYLAGMGTRKTLDSEKKGVSKKCFRWSGATADVCFTHRPDSATEGDWKVSDFEDMLNSVHKNIIDGHPFCGLDKWEDNHYAVDSQSFDPSGIVEYVNQKKPYHLCTSSKGSTSLHYVWDPTGWGIQLNFRFKSIPASCSSGALAKPLQNAWVLEPPSSHTNPACNVDLSVCPSTATAPEIGGNEIVV